MKLIQKVDHFTVFKSLPSTGYCSQKFLPNNLEKIGWLDVRGSGGCVVSQQLQLTPLDGVRANDRVNQQATVL